MLLDHCLFDLYEPILNPPQYDVYDECLVLLEQVASLDSHLGGKGVECTFKSSARHANIVLVRDAYLIDPGQDFVDMIV